MAALRHWHIQDWPANWVRDLLPWKIDLTCQ